MKEFKKLSPKKKFGQNFIEDQVLLNELVDLIEIEKKDIFVEIGPGTGNLTELIINKSTSCTSVEIDRNLVPLLEKRFKNIKGFKLINRDILSFNINTISVMAKKASALLAIFHTISRAQYLNGASKI